MLSNSGADIRHGGAKVYYSPGTDHLQMPPRECFTDEPHYYSTALHELAHWTGAKHRLNRLTDSQPFGSPEYAKEGDSALARSGFCVQSTLGNSLTTGWRRSSGSPNKSSGPPVSLRVMLRRS